MNEFLAKKLAESARSKPSQLKDKQELWQEIQIKAPGMAKDLKALSAMFGKLKLLSVEINGKH